MATSWSESEGVSVSYVGTAVYTNDAVNLTTEAGYRFAFAARTGDKDQDNFIDEVDLTTVAVPAREPAPFEEWLGGFFEPGIPEADTSADPDGDGRNNLLEYAFGSDPLQPDPAPARTAAPESDGSIRFVYQRPADREDLCISPLVSADLIEWLAPVVLDESTSAPVDAMESVTLDLTPPFDVADKAFLRIQVERSTQGVGGGEYLQSGD